MERKKRGHPENGRNGSMKEQQPDQRDMSGSDTKKFSAS